MNYEKILTEAHESGQKALNECQVTMYAWSSETVPLGETYDFKNKPYEVHGNCGCAWVATRERGNGQFVKFLKTKYGQDRIQKDPYRKAWDVPTNEMDMKGYNGQEVEPKYAYCQAYAQVLNDYGIKASAYEYLT